MPLNKLESFIKSTDGRILYVNPSDINATDSVTNDGASLTQPFVSIQRALLESARFSFVAGENNDLVEKTTILLLPGEYIVDNRPGWGIRRDGPSAKAFPPSGSSGAGDPTASSVLSLLLDSNFDLTDANNILYKFNSIYGGVVVPRGTSIVGLDLRKTKIRPKYVPNPTDSDIKKSAIFRITGACYFWQFSMFDGDEIGLVYTHPSDFSEINRSTPLFSHHKLTCFEYADGVNEVGDYGLTDLDMYYSKLSNAYNAYREIPENSKYPTSETAFAKKDPEWQIVGAFASDPINISTIISGDGSTADNTVTVTTTEDHNLSEGIPIKIRGVSSPTYNISTKIQSIINKNQFTYLLPSFPQNLPAIPSTSGATVTVETDTVSGASPYIFNCSLRSVWGMNGMIADGAKASGFRSMVVAQFTAVSLQKDDRAFVKYDKVSRTYNGVNITTVNGSDLPTGASQTDTTKVYHLDPDAIYRQGWESSHIKVSNDSFIQVVSVFAIGFNKHFDIESGGDASITNSNSNFGQISLNSDGFKAEAFDKDDHAFITSIIPPRDININNEENIEWLSIDVGLTTSASAGAATTTRLYLYGLNAKDSLPISLTQGYRVGARVNDKLYFELDGNEYSADIYMQDGVTSSFKVYDVTNVSNSILTIGNHTLKTGEKIIINSESGDLPENVIPHIVYYAISVNSTQIKLASSFTNALNGEFISIYKGTQLKVYSRVSDKNSGDIGSPIQFDQSRSNWYINVNNENTIYPQIKSLGVAVLSETTDLTYLKRIVDDRSLDEKLYKIRVVIPKEAKASKDPQTGFVLQESSSTNVRNNSDFTTPTIQSSDFNYNRNPRFITTCTLSSNTVIVLTDLPHGLNVDDLVVIRNVTDSNNVTGEYNRGYNGKFRVSALGDLSGNYRDTIFRYSTTDINGIQHIPGPVSTNNINDRTTLLPRFERNDLQSNLYIYRNELISSYIENAQDGIYHLYLLNASNSVTEQFTNLKYSQSPVDLYPQLDRDNPDANPPATKTFALRSPIGDINTSDLKKSITRESIDKTLSSLQIGYPITSFSGSTITFDRNHGLGGVVAGVLGTPNAGYNSGTHYNVKLLNGSSDPNSILSSWKGAIATVVVATGQNVTSVNITSTGSGYSSGETLYLDSSRVGSGNGNATYTISSVSGISTSIGDVVQVTGIGTLSDGYFRITSIPNTNQIGIARTSGDATIIPGQYAFIVGPSSKITSGSYSSSTGVMTFTTSTPHGLLSGNKFRIVDSSNNYVGDYVVKEKAGVNVFTSVTNINLSVNDGYILKHGLSANEGISDIREENFGSRQVSIYANEYVKLTNSITDDEGETTIPFSWINTGIGTDVRFPLGSYIQIDNELMRIKSTGSNTSFSVIRGVLGTRKESHDANSLIRKVHPIPIEFRRPSILRASGHTFEYLGYGPGNYSTGLPQIQVKSLSEREDFLVQAQERSCGAVVYTGMNSNGDFFSGNTKTSSVSGEITSYDIPNPTVTGQDPSKSSVVYDEITIKERLLVEGGDSGTVLSQFDGPVTFNQQTRFKNTSTFSGNVRITNETPSDSIGKGALTVKGGVGISKDLYVGGNVRFSSTTDSTSSSTGALTISGGVGIAKDLYVGSNIKVLGETNSTSSSTGALTISGGVGIAKDLYVGGNVRFSSTTDSTSSSTGALTISGGVGIAKDLYVGSNIKVLGETNSTSSSTGALTVKGGVGISKDLYVGGNVRFSSTTDSTSSSTGALTISGGVGIAKDLYVGGNVRFSSTTDSTSSSTGALTISGGVGIAKDLYVGETIYPKEIRWNENTDYAFIRFNSTSDSFPPSQLEIAVGDNGNSAGSGTAESIVFNQYDFTTSTVIRSFVLFDNSGNTTIPGALTVNGNVYIGNSSTDTINFTSRVNSNFIPSANDTYNLGSSTLKWKNIYAVNVSGNASTADEAATAVKLKTSRSISISGDLTWSVNFDGSGNVTAAGTLANSGVTAGTYGSTTNVPQITVDSKGRITSVSNQSINIPSIGGSSNQVIYRNSSGTITGSNNLTFNGSNLSVGGDITAFASDERLKENIKPIENALNKVSSLSGFTYNFNDLGKSLGFDTNIRYAGVSAQQVQKVLPEAIKTAPANPEYLTVQYEKIIPLLIESIKELSNKVDYLENKIITNK